MAETTNIQLKGLLSVFFMSILGAVQVSRDQDGGRGGVCQMITHDHTHPTGTFKALPRNLGC